jgi:hypothetical protein
MLGNLSHPIYKEHKSSNHICARIKSRIYTTELSRLGRAAVDQGRQIMIQESGSEDTGSPWVLNLGRPSPIQREVLDPREERVRSVGSGSDG